MRDLRITPLDIRQQEFKKCMRGFDPHEVQTFLEMVADEMELLTRENSDLFQELKEIEQKVEEYRKMEKTLQDTLASVNKATDQLKKGAEKEAEVKVREAEAKAAEIVRDATARLDRLHTQITGLQSEKRAFVARFRSLLLSQLRLLDQEERDEVENIELASAERGGKREDSLATLIEEEMKDET